MDRPDADAARALFARRCSSWLCALIVRGDGTVVEEVSGEPRPRAGQRSSVFGRIWDPVLSPDASKLAMVRTLEYTHVDRDELIVDHVEYRLVVRDRASGNERELLRPGTVRVRSLTWSADGTRLAALRDEELLVINVSTGATTLTTDVDRGLRPLDADVVWDWESNRLALHAYCTKVPCHAWIDPDRGTIEAVPAGSLNTSHTFGHGTWLSNDLSSGLDLSMLERMYFLFYGSPENTVSDTRIDWSADRRFYIYDRRESTMFHERTWWEAYDTRSRRKFLVKDLGKTFQIPVP